MFFYGELKTKNTATLQAYHRRYAFINYNQTIFLEGTINNSLIKFYLGIPKIGIGAEKI